MKKLLLATVLLLALGVFAQAQAYSPEVSAQKRVTRLDQKLQLTATQKEQITAIFIAQAQTDKMPDRTKKNMTPEERKEHIKARKDQRVAFDQQMTEILTPEQYANYQQLNKERKTKKMQRKANKSGANVQKKLNYLSKTLSLTTDQKAKVSDLLTAQHAAKTSKPAKKDWTSANRAANKEQRKAAKAAFDTKMKEILTATQYTTFQKLQKERREKGRKHGSLKR